MSTHPTQHHDDTPRPVPEALARTLARETSLRARLRYAAVGLAGLCGAALIATLWATEPGPLPPRTRAAFAALIALGLGWAALAAWTLARRRPLYARDRVMAAWLALAAAVATTSAGTALAAARGGAPAALAAGLTGLTLVLLAGALLMRARARRRALLRRVASP